MTEDEFAIHIIQGEFEEGRIVTLQDLQNKHLYIDFCIPSPIYNLLKKDKKT